MKTGVSITPRELPDTLGGSSQPGLLEERKQKWGGESGMGVRLWFRCICFQTA